jgi:hypothetical protein
MTYEAGDYTGNIVAFEQAAYIQPRNRLYSAMLAAARNKGSQRLPVPGGSGNRVLRMFNIAIVLGT